MKNEQYKAVVGYEGLYEVSDLGNVRSLDRVSTNSLGHKRKLTGKVLAFKINTDGRQFVSLSKKGKIKHIPIHVLVMEAFVSERPEGYQVLHADGDCLNNRLSNLSYDTPSQNRLDIYRQGKKHPTGKLEIEDVLEIRRLYDEENITQAELSKIFGVATSGISYIVNRQTFAWLNDDGTIDDSDTAVS